MNDVFSTEHVVHPYLGATRTRAVVSHLERAGSRKVEFTRRRINHPFLARAAVGLSRFAICAPGLHLLERAGGSI